MKSYRVEFLLHYRVVAGLEAESEQEVIQQLDSGLADYSDQCYDGTTIVEIREVEPT